MSSIIKAFVFDAYGTLLQVDSIDRLLRELYSEKAPQISPLWRSKQLEYSWLREIMGRYQPFSEVTKEALRYALLRNELPVEDAKVETLLRGYDELSVYPEVGECLQQLKGKYQLAVLSNANLRMLRAALSHNQMLNEFDQILSAEQVQCFKPNPKIYQLACDQLKLDRSEIAFVTANSWDAAGAKQFGLQVYWINRRQWPVEVLGVEPDVVVSGLLEIAV